RPKSSGVRIFSKGRALARRPTRQVTHPLRARWAPSNNPSSPGMIHVAVLCSTGEEMSDPGKADDPVTTRITLRLPNRAPVAEEFYRPPETEPDLAGPGRGGPW